MVCRIRYSVDVGHVLPNLVQNSLGIAACPLPPHQVWRSLLEENPPGIPKASLAEGAHARATADVDLPHHGRGAHVEPVGVERRQLLRLARLNDVRPLRDLEPALALQVLRECGNELLRLDLCNLTL